MPSISHVLDNTALHKILLGLRLPAALGLAAALLLYVDPHWFWPGLIVSALGLPLELWASGSIRARKALPVDGPYMFVRHPTHIARFPLILGLVLMTGMPWLLLIFVPVYGLYVAYKAGREEAELEDKFGTQYLRYSKRVPRFMPTLKPYEEGRPWYFNMKSFRRRYGEIVLVVFPVLYVACYVAAFHFR